eukprot:TRINITY_DN771_c2_g1_i1.p1 TRINITY_DN771_c2_g1~~TRINITY_DN771_c2_g1_i1.p1  ORF type:complete len:205 (-),score=32.31 TRINITY_DN771_c2_g1_i1:182-796(-)
MKALKSRWLEKYHQEQQEEQKQLSLQTDGGPQGIQVEESFDRSAERDKQQTEGDQQQQNSREELPKADVGDKRGLDAEENQNRILKKFRYVQEASRTPKAENAQSEQNVNGKEWKVNEPVTQTRVVKCQFEGRDETKDVELRGQGNLIELLRALKQQFNLQKLEDTTRIAYEDIDGDWLILSEKTQWQNFVQNVQKIKVVVNMV